MSEGASLGNWYARRRQTRLENLLRCRVELDKEDHRSDSYSTRRLIEEAQEELMDALLYLERLKEKLPHRRRSGRGAP